MAYKMLYLLIAIFHTGYGTRADSVKQEGSDNVQYVRRHGSFWLNCSTPKDAELLAVRFGKRVTNTRNVPLFKQLESKEGPPDIFVHNFNKSRLKSVGWGIVFVSDARPEDSGLYTCTVEKTIGEDLTIVKEITTVNVIVPPPRPIARTNRPVSSKGQSVLLTCSVRTSYLGPREFTWSKVNGSLNLTEHRVDRSNGNLKLLNPRLEDSGSYLCTLTTLGGVSTSNSIVITIKPDTFMLFCLAVGVTMVTVVAIGAFWFCRRKSSKGKGVYKGLSADVECLHGGPVYKHNPQYKLTADKSLDDKAHVEGEKPNWIVG